LATYYLSKERGNDIKRGAVAPLKHPWLLIIFQRRGGELRRGEASLIKFLPLPLTKGKGIKGIGLHNKNPLTT